ncbi:MAG TPA: aminotransferase class V-fold PLP-dependent enzyme [Clostridiaceae bacterium]|nr:aminotransferase class V-fold PLP-dependent enzyme [Clostridiaceae bacterium]
MIYMDNAATSWPKPETVYQAVERTLRQGGGNPGRGSYRMALSAGETLKETRMLCAQLFHAKDPDSISFAYNATTALNLALKGILQPGDHVLTSRMEHNAVARPLKRMEDMGIRTTKVQTSVDSGIDLEALEAAIEAETKLIVCSHVTNVTGTVNPLKEIGALCRRRGILFLVDASQSAGTRAIDVQEMGIDMLAFTGHKGLLGPQGTGGLYLREGLQLQTLIEGGTGSVSESLFQPEKGPSRYESGTQNGPGIAGLGEGIRFLLKEGIETIGKREAFLTDRLLSGFSLLENVRVYGPAPGFPRGNVVSIAIHGFETSDIAMALDQVFEISVRSGLHCAADAHQLLGTADTGGLVRFSPGYFTTEDEIDQCIEAVSAISRGEVIL